MRDPKARADIVRNVGPRIMEFATGSMESMAEYRIELARRLADERARRKILLP
jgi:hypothetical protein